MNIRRYEYETIAKIEQSYYQTTIETVNRGNHNSLISVVINYSVMATNYSPSLTVNKSHFSHGQNQVRYTGPVSYTHLTLPTIYSV